MKECGQISNHVQMQMHAIRSGSEGGHPFWREVAAQSLLREPIWIGANEQAREIRSRLREAFPRTKFSVRQEPRYSSGYVRWESGPAVKKVASVLMDLVNGRRLDMGDMWVPEDLFVTKDGLVYRATAPVKMTFLEARQIMADAKSIRLPAKFRLERGSW